MTLAVIDGNLLTCGGGNAWRLGNGMRANVNVRLGKVTLNFVVLKEQLKHSIAGLLILEAM